MWFARNLLELTKQEDRIQHLFCVLMCQEIQEKTTLRVKGLNEYSFSTSLFIRYTIKTVFHYYFHHEITTEGDR